MDEDVPAASLRRGGPLVFKLSKTTDYGIVLMAQLASEPSDVPQNARELSAGKPFRR